jgi:hypothetical protein
MSTSLSMFVFTATAVIIAAATPPDAHRDSTGPRAAHAPRTPRTHASPRTASGGGLVPTNGGRTVYDSKARVTWLADGNLAASQKFNVANINRDGSMDYATAVKWIAAMNAYQGAGYLKHKNWSLPTTPNADPKCTSHNKIRFGFRLRPQRDGVAVL